MDKVKGKLENLSLKKSLTIIVLIILIAVAGLSVVTIWGCASVQQKILQSRGIVIKNYELLDKSNDTIQIRTKDYEFENLTTRKAAIFFLVNISNILFPILYVIAGVICAASLFYKVKLKQPINILKQSATKVAENDLDFSVDYQNTDEMGQLCDAFEKMRKELYRNNQAMWQMIDERRQFNASVSHDLRTPITVVKGYTEYLQKNIPKGKISADKLLQTLENIMESVNRLEKYVDSVHNVQVMEQMELHPEAISLHKFVQELKDNMFIVAEQFNKTLLFSSAIGEVSVMLDQQILFRILENIIGNAMRYAKQIVKVSCFLENGYLCFRISDDGKGFSAEDLKFACCPFYTDKQGAEHLGIGLAICKTLCKKHGGDLILSNQKDRGANVIVTILVK